MKFIAALSLAVFLALISAAPTRAQGGTPQPVATPTPEVVEEAMPPDATTPETTAQPTPPAPVETEEERAVRAYYESLRAVDYRLGPEDVISVTVFNQPNYSKANITVPPDGRIGLPLIVEGVMVIGKTPIQVQEEVTKKLDEYIIDPKVTVTLEKAVSARYGIVGDVAAPGAKVMLRRTTLYEAITEAGGVLRSGDKQKIVLLRRTESGVPQPYVYNLKDYESGRAQQAIYLLPGDTIVVPGKSFSFKRLDDVLKVVSLGGSVRSVVPGIR